MCIVGTNCHRENKEMDNFICLLDNTLKMNSEADKSDEELVGVAVSPPRPGQNGRQQQAPLQRKHSAEALTTPVEQKPAPAEEPVPVIHKSASMPSMYLMVLPLCE